MSTIRFDAAHGAAAFGAPPAPASIASEVGAVIGSRHAGADDMAASLMRTLPELKWYTHAVGGEIATSPGVQEVGDAELHRTVGAMVALYSLMENKPTWYVNLLFGMSEVLYTAAHKKFLKQCNCGAADAPERDVLYYLMAVHDMGKSKLFRDEVNAVLPVDKRTDNHDTILGHAFDILANSLPGHEGLSRILPNFARLDTGFQQQLAKGFLSDFHLPQLMQGESSVLALDGFFGAGMSDTGKAMYLYHSIFDAAGSGCTLPTKVPVAIKPVYDWAGVIETLIKMPSGKDIHPYHTILFNAVKNNEKVKAAGLLGSTAAIGDDDELAFLRVMALSRNNFAKPAALKTALMRTEFQGLRRELAGQAGNPQIMIYYAPDMVQKTLVPDDAESEAAGYTHMLLAMDALYKLPRARLAGDNRPPMTFEVNISKLNKTINYLKDSDGSVFTGKQLLGLVRSKTLSLVVNTPFDTEALLELQ